MIRKCLMWIWILAWIPGSLFARYILTGRVCKSSTGKGIENVQVLFDSTGVVTDSSGYFNLDCKTALYPVELWIRHIQYKPTTVMVNGPDAETYIELEPAVLQTDDITVIAEQPIRFSSTVSARSISKKEIEAIVPSTTSEVLIRTPGIVVKDPYQSPIVLRGLSGQRLLILRNGNRRFSSYPAGFMSHVVNIYDLEKVDVEKGPASVTLGAGAIAGVINLIDKSPFKQKGLNARVTTGYASNNNEKNTLYCGGWSNGTFALKGAYRDRNAGVYHDADGSRAVNSFYGDKDVFTAAGLHTNRQELRLYVELHRGGPWGKPVGFSGTRYLHVKTLAENSDNYSMHYDYSPGGVLEKLAFSAYYARENRDQQKLYLNAGTKAPSYQELTLYSDSWYGAKVAPLFRLNKDMTLQYGAEFYRFSISSPVNITDYYNGYYFENQVSRNARSLTSGSFAELKYRAGSHLSLQGGVRYDHTAVYEGDVFSLEQELERRTQTGALSGAFAAQYLLGTFSRIKINLAKAFRMPTPQEMFSDTYTANGILYGNPELMPEYSRNIDLVYLFSHPAFRFEVSPFYWLLDDMISKEIVYDMPGLNYEYVNIGRAEIYGGEVEIRIQLDDAFWNTDDLHFSLGAAYTHGTEITEYDSGTLYEPLDYIPPFHVKAELGYGFSISKRLTVNSMLSVQQYSRQARLPDDAYVTPEYALFSLMLGVKYRHRYGNSVVRLVVNNFMNTQYYAFQSFVPGKGRDVRLYCSLAI